MNYKYCNTCGKRIWRTRKHHCLDYRNGRRKDIRIKFSIGGGRAKGGIESLRKIIKEEYIKKTFYFDPKDRTKIVRLCMDAVKPNLGRRDISVLRMFLRRFYLTNAEIAAIVHHTGYRYKNGSTIALRNIQIDGYLNPNLEKKEVKTTAN